MRNLKRVLASAGVITAAAIALVACNGGSPFMAPDTPDKTAVQQNTDPRQGWVRVAEPSDGLGAYVNKMCDGTTLVYISADYKAGGMSAVPNSPECGSPTS